jgi:hypothetical protein
MAPRRAIATAALTGIVGAVLGVLWATREPAPAPPGADLGGEVETLREQLAAERDARRALEGEIAMLRLALDDAGPGAEAPKPTAASPPPAPDAPAPTGSTDAQGVDLWDDAGARAGAGITASEAQRLKERFEEHEMQLLFLRDRARREGWLRRRRFREEQDALRNALREDLGDADYDRMLWLAGRTNRVTIADVISRSAAEAAGLQSGDQIASYAGARIFEVSQLTRATSEGRPGELTELRYRRAGEERRVYVPRGPLGIRLRPDRGAPDTLR